MKKILRLFSVLSAVVLCSGRLLALQEIDNVTPARAKELGISTTSRTSGDGMTCYELTFPVTGELKDFARVELRIYDAHGKEAAYAPLQVTHPDEKTASAYFCVGKDALESCTVTIAAGRPRGGVAYLIQLAKLPVAKPEPPPEPRPSSQPLQPAPPASDGR